MDMVPMGSRKRKYAAEAADASFDELLNQDVMERVLSRLPPSAFFRLRSVCRRWSSVASSATFRLACSAVQSREPWFLMVGGQDQDQDQDQGQSTIFDTSEGDWKNLDHLSFLQQARFSNAVPVASSGGLVCFQAPSGQFFICNPAAATSRELPPVPDAGEKNLHAIAMTTKSLSSSSSYRIILVFGELPILNVRVFDSDKGQWGEEFRLRKESINTSSHEPRDAAGADEEDTAYYFLSKAGDVVSTNMQRSPSKQYSSVLTVEGDGEEVVYFLSQSGTVVSCNLARKTYCEFPRLMPVFFEYSVDLVACNGEMLAVVLSDFLDTASLRVWKFSKVGKQWQQVASMPPSMSHDFFKKKADINCLGCGGGGDSFLVCINSGECTSYVMCSLTGNQWVELPKCVVNGRAKEFTAAISFEPRIEVSV